MASYNRQPIVSEIPDPAPTYYFSYNEFKGINEDKNFLAVDQETFADAKNVYINSNGVLKSRPPLRVAEQANDKILNFWSFSQIVVYLINANSGKDILIVDGDLEVKEHIVSDNFLVKEMDNKLIMFSDFGNDVYIKYYDKNDKTIHNGDDVLYIPDTSAYSDVFMEEVETKNILTSKENVVFLYNKEVGLSPNIYNLDKVKYEIETPISKNEIEVKLDDLINNNIIDYLYSLSDSILDTDEFGQLICIDKVNKVIRYSPDGKSFSNTYTRRFNEIMSYGFTCGFTNGFTKDGGDNYNNYLISVKTDSGYETYRIALGELTVDSKTDIWYIPCKNKSSWNVRAEVRPISNGSNYIHVVLKEINTGEWGNSTSYFVTHTVENLGSNPRCALDFYYSYNQAGSDRYYTVSSFIAGETSYAKYLREMANNDKYSTSDDRFNVTKDAGNFIGATAQYAYYFKDKNINAVNYSSNINYPIDLEFTEDTVWHMSDGKFIFTNCIVKGEFWECGVYDFINEPYKVILPDYDGVITDVAGGKNIYIMKQKDNIPQIPVYSTNFDTAIELRGESTGGQQNVASKFKFASTLNEHYFAIDNYLYISQYRENPSSNEFELYIPEINKQKFNSNIVALHPISDSIMAVFTENDIWYVQNSENGYLYYKAKLSLSLKKEPDIVTDRSGVATLLCDRNGLLQLSYQSFMATSEQSFSYLSSAISSRFENGEINKITIYKDYVFCYDGESSNVYLFDVRNKSWWHWDLNTPVNEIKVLTNDAWDYELAILSDGVIYRFDKDVDLYCDIINNDERRIEWFVKSQKLHFNAPNRYKRITNMTFYNAEESEGRVSTTVDLSINNYRKYTDKGKPENFEYDVEMIKTYVKRLNYSKINEFEYTLKSDDETVTPSPLSLGNISIKYRVGNEVR